jgi:hypothetical protein
MLATSVGIGTAAGLFANALLFVLSVFGVSDALGSEADGFCSGSPRALFKFKRGALSILVMPLSVQIGHSTKPRDSWLWKSSSEANQPSKLC